MRLCRLRSIFGRRLARPRGTGCWVAPVHPGQSDRYGVEWQVQAAGNGLVSLVALLNRHASSTTATLPTLPPLGFVAGLGCVGSDGLHEPVFVRRWRFFPFFVVIAQMLSSKGLDHSVMVWRH